MEEKRNIEWKAETTPEYGPHLRMYEDGKKTQILILAKYADRKYSKYIPVQAFDDLDALMRIDDEIPF